MVGSKNPSPGHISFWSLVQEGDAIKPHVTFDPKKQLALLYYSSGTTGLPKGGRVGLVVRQSAKG